MFSSGRIEIEIPFNAPPDRPCRIWMQSADDPFEAFCVGVCDQSTIQAEMSPDQAGILADKLGAATVGK